MANVPKHCAACTHRRKRCTESCPLAPYFPMEKMDDFLRVNKLYGVSRFVKIMESVPIDKRDKAAETIICEAKTRELNPIHGSLAETNRINEAKNLTKELISAVQRDTQFIKNVAEIEKEMNNLDTILDSNPLEFLSSSSSSSFMDGNENENENARPSSSAAETSHHHAASK